MQAAFELPERIENRAMCRLPLASFVAKGKTIGSYLDKLPPKDDKSR